MAQLKAINDKLLTDVLIGFNPTGFISDQLLPLVTHSQYSGEIGHFGKNHLRLENANKGGKAPYKRIDVAARSVSTFKITGHGLSDLVTKEDYANVDDPFDAESDVTMGLKMLMDIEQEYTIASGLTSTSVITQNTTLSGDEQYDDQTNSDPLADFAAARQAVRSGCGLIPDTAVVPWEVFNVLRYHPQILERLGFIHNRAGGLSIGELASAMEVKKIFVPECMYLSSKEGQTEVMSPIWGKDILFGVLPTSAAKFQTSLAYMIRPKNGSAKKVYKNAIMNPPDATEILVENEYEALVSNASAGYLIKAAIA